MTTNAERLALADKLDRHARNFTNSYNYCTAAVLTAAASLIRAQPAEAGAIVERALEFYADPFAWKKLHDPDNDIQVPDFYSETSFGDTAQEALAAIRALNVAPPAPVVEQAARGGLDFDWHAESVKLYRANKSLRKALQEQHDWHLAQGDKDFGDGVILDMAAEYGDSAMYERTTAALSETLPPGIQGYETWKEQQSPRPALNDPVVDHRLGPDFHFDNTKMAATPPRWKPRPETTEQGGASK